MDAHVSVEKKH